MGKLNKDNFKKTIYYLQKNGLKNTLYAVRERLQKKETDDYTYVPVPEETLTRQRETVWENPVTFSIVVPVYHTPEEYFREMVDSVLLQTYPYFELILVDAGAQVTAGTKAQAGENGAQAHEENQVPRFLEAYGEEKRIRYLPLEKNIGIAENTNVGIEAATGDYIALLDHDDFLTPDALYEMAKRLEAERMQGNELQMIYTDEDKCNSDASKFYEPHFKLDFNLDLLLTNNYICHFTAVKAELMKEFKLRGEYNGAQDFDLVLRVAARLYEEPEKIAHIPKVLYHWRCHEASTAANPASKLYAYEAGKRAVEAFIKEKGWNAKVVHLKHLGFYRVEYEDDIFTIRPEVGAVGGRILDKSKKLCGGMMSETGEVFAMGLADGFSGYVNRAALVQQAQALDLRLFRLNPACKELFEETLKISYTVIENGKCDQFDWQTIEEKEKKLFSLKISEALRSQGYKLLWDPQWSER